jgi:glycosyltransferase involved in cell wall biosynthesis
MYADRGTLNMLNITILTTSHSTFDTRIFHKEARSLADAGFDVTLITPHNKDLVRDGVRIRAVGEADVESAGFDAAREMYNEAKSICADVYHLHDPGLLPFGVLLSNKTDAKVIYDCHEDYGRAFQYYDSIPLSPITSRIYPSLQSLLVKKLDAVIAATDWIAEDFRQRGHKEVALVRNFPRLSMANTGTATIQDDHKYHMVYVGGLSEERGLSNMINLTSKLREKDVDVSLWLIGKVGRDIEKKLEQLIEDNGIKNSVKTFGYVEPENIFRYLRAADLGLCLLNRGRAEYIIPTKIFEYMLSGIPVLATRTEGTQAYLPENCGKLAESKISDQVNTAKKILLDAEMRKQMGKAAEQKVHEEYSWENEQNYLLSLYDRLQNDE